MSAITATTATLREPDAPPFTPLHTRVWAYAPLQSGGVIYVGVVPPRIPRFLSLDEDFESFLLEDEDYVLVRVTGVRRDVCAALACCRHATLVWRDEEGVASSAQVSVIGRTSLAILPTPNIWARPNRRRAFQGKVNR